MPANLMHAHIFYRHIKRLGCFAVLLLAGLTAQLEAQEIALAESKMDVNPSTTKMHKLFAHDQDYYYVIRFYANQYYLEKLDQNLEPLLEEPIKPFQGINTFQLEGVIHFHNELYVFFSFTRIDEIVLYYQKIDKNTMKPFTSPVALTTIHTIKGAWASFYFALSHRETKLLIACRTKLTVRRDQYNEYYVYDEGLSLVWKKKDTYEFRGQGPRDNIYVVDEIGNVSILSLLKQENIISLIRKNRNLYTIYRYTHEGTDFNTYPVTLEKQEGCAMLIYDAFSPNGDDKNPVWHIGNIENFPDCTVRIFNIWGIEVFSSKGYGIPWDGKYEGKDLPSGTYYYVIDPGDGSSTRTGAVSIVK